MRTPRIVKASTNADLLKLVPAVVGLDPRESLVLVAFTGTRTAGAMRFDLPRIGAGTDVGSAAVPAMAGRAVGAILRLERVDGVVPVVYTDATFADHPRTPHRDLLELVAAGCARHGLVVKDLLCVGGDGWASLQQSEPVVDVRPLLDLVPDDLAGIDDVLDAERLTTPPQVDEAAQDRFTARVEAWLVGAGHASAVHGLPVDVGFPAAGGLVDRALAGQDVTPFIEHALARHPEADEPCECRALLVALLCAPVLRDVVMLQAGWGQRFGRHVALHSIPVGGEVDEAMYLAFSGGDFARPDGDRSERAADLLVETAGRLLPGDRGPALATAAWLRWCLGQGSIAGRLVDAALAAEPDYGLAEILHLRLAHGHLPEWAFRSTPGTAVGRTWLARRRPPR